MDAVARLLGLPRFRLAKLSRQLLNGVDLIMLGGFSCCLRDDFRLLRDDPFLKECATWSMLIS